MGDLIRRFLMSLLQLLIDERGEVKLETEEELETSKDESVKKEGEDTEDLEAEDTADTDEALKESEKEEEESEPPPDVPYARFAEKHAEAEQGKEFKTKLDQFKRLGPDGYYQLYPDEKPKVEEKEEEEEATGILSASEMADHRISGGDHDGKTLGEVMELDVLSGLDIYNAYKADMEGKKVSDAKLREESEREVQTFTSARAQEAFGKDGDDLTKEEVAQVEELSNAVTQWMVDTGRGGGNIEDGYFLMNKEKFFDEAKTESLKGLIEALKTPGTASISSGKTEPAGTGYTRFLNLTPDQAKAECDKFTEAENDEFMKKAPAEVRKKFPSLPWDDA